MLREENWAVDMALRVKVVKVLSCRHQDLCFPGYSERDLLSIMEHIQNKCRRGELIT